MRFEWLVLDDMNTKQFWNVLEMILQKWLIVLKKKKGLYMEGAALSTIGDCLLCASQGAALDWYD